MLADDDALLLGLLERMLERHFDIVATAPKGRALVDQIQRLKPDVAVSANPEPALAAEALRLGAAGYVLKQNACAELVPAIRAVLHGHTYFASS